jgi:uncharacterized membrane-anchored protein YitT (DUF2179 family)
MTDAAAGIRHSLLEDVLGILTGTFVASLGLFLLRTTGAVTGGTAGLSLLISYTGWPFELVFLAVNLPFLVLAIRGRGWDFTVRTIIAVMLVSAFSAIHPALFRIDGLTDLDPVYAVLGGNTLAGVGILILFRHRASLGGFGILALILQDRLGWRAGYVQMALDVVVVLAALTVVPPLGVALSAAGAVLLNLILALNHRPGRYLGS